jgi:hypothetical protein
MPVKGATIREELHEGKKVFQSLDIPVQKLVALELDGKPLWGREEQWRVCAYHHRREEYNET